MNTMMLHHSMLPVSIHSTAANSSDVTSTYHLHSESTASSEPSSPVHQNEDDKIIEEDDVFMDDGDDDEDDQPSGKQRPSGTSKPSGNQKVICDCKACCTMGKTRWVSKSTRSRHRRRFSVATPFSTSSSPKISTTVVAPLRIQRGRPRIQVAPPQQIAHSEPERSSEDQGGYLSKGHHSAGLASSGGESIDTPQMHSRTMMTSSNQQLISSGSNSTMFLDGSDGSTSQSSVVLVNRNLDDHLNPENFKQHHLDSMADSQHLRSKPSPADDKKKVVVEDPVERITVTLFRDILSSLWTEFCA
jgi:hypothetical protein